MKKIALLSDIHGNRAALSACIEKLRRERITELIFLGDYVGYFPYPERAMDMIYDIAQSREFSCRFIRGNGDEYHIAHRAAFRSSGEHAWPYGDIASGTLRYTYEHLRDKDIDFFESLDTTGKYAEDGVEVFEYCHGSPTSTKQKLFPGSQATDEILDGLSSDVLFCAHIHRPGVYRRNGKRLVNVGAVGMAWDAGASATFAVAETDGGRVRDIELVYVDYDKAPVLEEFRESGLAEVGRADARMNMFQFVHGYDIWGECMERAAKLYEEENGTPHNGGTPPESYVERALDEITKE